MFQVGDKVVYPMHGAGVIESIEEKEILGEIEQYYVLRLPVGGMKVMIPIRSVEQIGIRQVISSDEVHRVIQVLSGKETFMPLNWNKRYRSNMDRMKSGDVFEVAGVVKNLTLRDKDKGLSSVERKMLNSARQILISELVLSENSDEKSITLMVDKLADLGNEQILEN